MTKEMLWHISTLSNFARGYDRYARRYDKAAIPQSTHPDQFFLLRETELKVGVEKAHRLLDRLNMTGDRLIALGTQLMSDELRENTRTGVGRYVERGWIGLDSVAWVNEDTTLAPATVEEASALSLQVLHPKMLSFADLHPRTLSVLPIARGCQASCPFCFSEASVSADQDQAALRLDHIRSWAARARDSGAERFVITGGGEPGLLRHDLLCELMSIGSAALGKAVLISNGHHLARRDALARQEALSAYYGSGLNVLSISRHHHDQATNSRLMSLDTDAAAIAETWRCGARQWPRLRLRFICLLQQGGIDSSAAVAEYLDWAVSLGVTEICFKELYVSTSIESVYYRREANAWSHAHQVPLSVVLDFAREHAFEEVSRLPWGSPVFSGTWQGSLMQIAAYTEPSLLWERSHGIARSWNLMSDGRCLVSLEDRQSEITPSLTA